MCKETETMQECMFRPRLSPLLGSAWPLANDNCSTSGILITQENNLHHVLKPTNNRLVSHFSGKLYVNNGF